MTKISNVGLVGANLGYRIAAKNLHPDVLAAIARGEDRVLRQGRIFNGKEPGLQNGTTLLPKYRRLLDAKNPFNR